DVITVQFNNGIQILSKKTATKISCNYNAASDVNILCLDNDGNPDTYTFYDEYKGQPRFHIVAHGSPEGEIYIDDIPCGADRPIEIASEAFKEREFSSIRIL